MKQKKCYKTFKFWITTLLALSASSIITSLALTSCVANDNTNKSDIIINNQTEDKEFSIDDNNDLTLSVDATSNSGVVLCYQWYVNKDANANENSWEKIAGATQKTYTITASEIKDIDEETTWRYKADIYPENNENQKIESKPIPVKIKPPVGGPIPDKPNIPNENPNPPETPPNITPPEITPPGQPETPPDTSPPVEPPIDGQPTPTPPPSYNPDNPTIVPSPEHQPSKGIGARLPLDKNGIVTTKYPQEQWIGDNSLSLLIEARPNAKGISNAVNNFIKNSSNPNIKRILQDFSTTVELASNLNNSYYNQFGTGWILDYSDSNSANIKDYYIATNMHVMSSYFTFTFTSTRYGSNFDEPINVGVRIPFNKTTVSNLDVYISQPKYNLADQKNNERSYANELKNQWYKTNVDINNWEENLIPIGAYEPTNNTGFEYSQGFDMELTWEYQNSSNFRQTLYFKSSDNGGYLEKNPDIGNNSFQKNIDDFSVFKISLNNNSFDGMIQSTNGYSERFKRLKNLFNVSSIDTAKNNSTYIRKLNELINITSPEKTYTKAKVDELFMFAESDDIIKGNTQISIGGFPLMKELVSTGGNNSYRWDSYTTFNTNTLTGNNIIEYPLQYYNTRDKMGINQYTYKGNLYKINWKDPNNFILKNVNLLAGSSGGVGIDKNYKLSCINWGTFIQIEYYQGIKYVLDSSSSTGLYSSTNKNSLIWKWVDYVNKNNKNTKLAQLFKQLEQHDYFNK